MLLNGYLLLMDPLAHLLKGRGFSVRVGEAGVVQDFEVFGEQPHLLGIDIVESKEGLDDPLVLGDQAIIV